MLFPNTYLLALPFLSTAAQAALLYTSSYEGNVTTLNLTSQYEPGLTSIPLVYSLTTVSSIICAESPSWLTLDSHEGRLYCIGEGLAGIKGGITVFNTQTNGPLKWLTTTDIGPNAVNSVIYGAPGNASTLDLVLANYSGSLNTYNIFQSLLGSSPRPPPPPPPHTTSIPALVPIPDSPPTLLQTLNFSFPTPGPPGRQSEPHPHQAVLDPTHQYILSPDLGADLVRVFRIQNSTGTLIPCHDLQVKNGTGARHVAFWRATTTATRGAKATTTTKPKDNGTPHPGFFNGPHNAARAVERRWQRAMKQEEYRGQQEEVSKRAEQAEGQLFMYLVGELANTITTFAVTYPAAGGMAFEELNSTNTFGGKAGSMKTFNGRAVPTGAAAAEIAVSGNHLIVSNRGDSYFGDSMSAGGPSDSLATFDIGPDGALTFKALNDAGGVYPRSFSLNRAGNLVAVGLQHSGSVVVLSRDVDTGKLGSPVAMMKGLKNVTCVVWNET